MLLALAERRRTLASTLDALISDPTPTANRYRRCKKSRIILAALARTAHYDHFMRGKIAEPQPPIAFSPPTP